jgi:hypothetical protein
MLELPDVLSSFLGPELLELFVQELLARVTHCLSEHESNSIILELQSSCGPLLAPDPELPAVDEHSIGTELGNRMVATKPVRICMCSEYYEWRKVAG